MKKIITGSGAACLITGSFLPIISTPDRTISFFDTLPVNIPGVPPDTLKYAGIAIIAIAVVSMILVFTRKAKFVWLGGIFTGAILASVYFGFHAKLDGMKEQADKQVGDLFGGMFKGVTELLFQSVHLGGAGWYVVSAGALLLIIASFTFRRNTINQ